MEQTIAELKSIQSHPKFYLANYFQELKTKVDFVFNSEKLNEKAKYLEIINEIESFEQECYKIKPFTFSKEIESVKKDRQSLDDLKYRIEMKLFQNKSILFLNNYGCFRRTFLLIINDEYLRKSTFDNTSCEYFNREQLIAYILRIKLGNIDDRTNIVFLNIQASNLSEIIINNNTIRNIDSFTFNGLINLKKINFNNNQINELPINIFSELIGLEEIDFSFNKIMKLNSFIFDGLIKLRVINFGFNRIEELDKNILNGLINLEFITLTGNKIKEINPTLFRDSKSLEYIYLSSNKIKEIHTNTFDGLNNLKHLYICNNRIKNLNSFALNDDLIHTEEMRFDF